MFEFEMFFGRFHPLVVHLPIGFLALAILFKFLDQRSQSLVYRPAFKLTLFLSGVVAVITCVTGVLLSWSSTYPAPDLDRHMWAGFLLTLATIVWYLIEFHRKSSLVVQFLMLGLTAVMLMVTGHRGGVLTHGKQYLSEGLPVAWQEYLGQDPFASAELEFEISNLDSAVVYEDIVVPILEARCYSCHGDRKRKGELRLDELKWIRQGGESGESLIASDLTHSKLYQVLTLPVDDDLHMPPKGRSQLTDLEIEVVGAWIREGADADRMVFQYTERNDLETWYEDLNEEKKLFANPLIPDDSVEEPDEDLVRKMQDLGVLIQRVGMDNNYMEMSFINVRELTLQIITEAIQLKDNVIWMDLSGHQLDVDHMEQLTHFTSVTDLNLANSTLPSEGLKTLSALPHVQVLNLTGAKLGGSGMEELEDWASLRSVYVFQSGISPRSAVLFARGNPGISVDTGGYSLPLVARDTTVFRRRYDFGANFLTR